MNFQVLVTARWSPQTLGEARMRRGLSWVWADLGKEPHAMAADEQPGQGPSGPAPIVPDSIATLPMLVSIQPLIKKLSERARHGADLHLCGAVLYVHLSRWAAPWVEDQPIEDWWEPIVQVTVPCGVSTEALALRFSDALATTATHENYLRHNEASIARGARDKASWDGNRDEGDRAPEYLASADGDSASDDTVEPELTDWETLYALVSEALALKSAIDGDEIHQLYPHGDGSIAAMLDVDDSAAYVRPSWMPTLFVLFEQGYEPSPLSSCRAAGAIVQYDERGTTVVGMTLYARLSDARRAWRSLLDDQHC